jgi:hypothetical protein
VDDATEALLRELQSSPTDLRTLVVNTVCRPHTDIAIEAEAVARWNREDPRRWTAVQDWLVARGIRITIVTAAKTADGRSRRVNR